MSALFYINNKGLCHRDLKPENLFFDEDFNLKLADFGFSTCLSGKTGDGKLNTVLGTPEYMAPEIIMKQQTYKGIPIDLFSSAIILFIFMTGKPCFNQAHPNDPNYKLLCTNKHVLFWKQHMHRNQMQFNKDFIDLMNAMLAFDPLNRPTIPEILSHAWLQGQTATSEQVKDYFSKCKLVVDSSLEQQKIDEDKNKIMKKQAQQNMNNFAFGQMNQVCRGEGQDEEQLVKRAEIESKLNQLSFEKHKFPLIDIKENRKPTTLVSGIDSKSLLEVLFFCSNEVCETFDYDLNKGKFKVNFVSDNINTKVDLQVYETKNGLKIVEFMKKNGTCNNYNDFCKKFRTEFENHIEE